MNRRQFFELGAGACASAATGTACLGVPGTEALASVRTLATELYDSFDDATRKKVCVAYDHPLRQGKVSDPHLRLRDATIQYVKRHGFV